MYNEKQKLEYINASKEFNVQLTKWMSNVFRDTEAMEVSLQKDVAEWTSAEIIDYFKLISVPSLRSILQRHSQLRAYARWCGEHFLLKDNQNHYDEVDADILQLCVNNVMTDESILTKGKMKELIKDLLNVRDQCLIYALFEGIMGTKLSELASLNVNQIEGNKLHLAERTIEVSDEFLELMRESSETYSYYTYGSKCMQKPFKENDDRVFKMTNTAQEIKTTDETERKRLYSNLIRIKDYVGNPAITIQSLHESGRIHMIKQLMAKSPGLSAREVINANKDSIENKYGNMYGNTNYLRAYGRYLETES